MRYNTHFRNCETVSRLALVLVNSFIFSPVPEGPDRAFSAYWEV
jgi:hypothetical protein